tara:strand:+ start:1711 stop:2196 length:486 start_codon:yes stop_codon:yes gene_type:complete
MAISTGTTAPAFTLKSKTADGLNEISLADSAGKQKTLLLFFPLAFTGTCEEELCTVSGGLSDYTGLNAVVYGISVDSPFAQEAFAKSAGITIPLLSDFNKEVSTAYGILDADFVPGALSFKGVAKRSAFIVDESGTVTYAWSSDVPSVLPPFDEIKAALGA